jgi:hypothetical protein
MIRVLDAARHLPCRLFVDNADAFHQLPREGFLNQELGLLSLFHNRVSPIVLVDRLPVQNFKVMDIAEERRVSSTSVAVAERPTAGDRICPLNHRPQICFQMHNWPLPAAVRQIRVISSVQQEQHDRAWAEIERDVLSNLRAGVTIHLKFLKPPALNLAHPDDCTVQCAPAALRIGPEDTIDDLREIIQVRDVIDLLVLRRHWPFIVDASVYLRLGVRPGAPK